MKQLQSKLIEYYSPVIFFIFFSLISTLLSFLHNEFLSTDELFYNNYSEKYDYDTIEDMARLISKIELVIYFITPILYFFKFVIVAIVLNIGDILNDYKIGFRRLFQVAMIAETVFFIPKLIKLFWFLLFHEAQTMQEFGDFNFLSILSMFNKDEIYPWLIYPFSIANIFELFYWLFLSFLVFKFSKLDYNKSLGLVLSTYVVALIVWVVFMMFISLNMS